MSNGNGEPEGDEAPLSELPAGAACSACVFSRVTAPDPNSLQRLRVCKRFPPPAILAQTQHGMGVLSYDRVVRDADFCYEFEQREGAEVIPVTFG